MRGTGDVSGSSNSGRNPAAALLRPGQHSGPKPAPSPTGTQMGDVMLQQRRGSRGEGFFSYFSAHSKTRVQSQRGADSLKCRISHISIAQLVRAPVYPHRLSCTTTGFSCTGFQSLNVPFIRTLEQFHISSIIQTLKNFSTPRRFPSEHLYTTGVSSKFTAAVCAARTPTFNYTV